MNKCDWCDYEFTGKEDFQHSPAKIELIINKGKYKSIELNYVCRDCLAEFEKSFRERIVE
jgi:hypothetical protein